MNSMSLRNVHEGADNPNDSLMDTSQNQLLKKKTTNYPLSPQMHAKSTFARTLHNQMGGFMVSPLPKTTRIVNSSFGHTFRDKPVMNDQYYSSNTNESVIMQLQSRETGNQSVVGKNPAMEETADGININTVRASMGLSPENSHIPFRINMMNYNSGDDRRGSESFISPPPLGAGNAALGALARGSILQSLMSNALSASKKDVQSDDNAESHNRKYRVFKKFMKEDAETPFKKTSTMKNAFSTGNASVSATGKDSGNDSYDESNVSDMPNGEGIFRSRFIVWPDSFFRIMWDIVGLLFIIYQAILFPYRFAFKLKSSGGWWALDLAIDFFFIFDILLNFNTSYYFKGTLVVTRKEISMYYLKSWFFLDLISSFPYDVLDSDHSGEIENYYDSNVNPRIAYVELLRLLRILKVRKLFIKIEDYFLSDKVAAFLDSIKLISIIALIGHWIACIFLAVGLSQCTVRPQCWLTNAGILDSSEEDKYIVALYWAFMTMTTVGYGDVSPYTVTEKLYGMFCMIVACGVFAYTVGSIGNVVTKLNTVAEQYKEKMIYVNQYLAHKQLPKELRLKVRRYLEYMWEFKKQLKIGDKEVMDMLNENLRDQITIYVNGKVLKSVRPLQANFNLDFLSRLIFNLKSETYAVGDHIIEEGDVGSKLYYIINGKVAIMHKKTHTYIKDLKKDEYFGEIGFFSDLPRQASVRSKDFTEVIYLDKEYFIDIAGHFPKAIAKYEAIREKINTSKDFYDLKIICYICKKAHHLAIDCPGFGTYKGNLRKYIKKYQKKLMTKRTGMTPKSEGKSGANSRTIHEDGTVFHNNDSNDQIDELDEENEDDEEKAKTQSSKYWTYQGTEDDEAELKARFNALYGTHFGGDVSRFPAKPKLKKSDKSISSRVSSAGGKAKLKTNLMSPKTAKSHKNAIEMSRLSPNSKKFEIRRGSTSFAFPSNGFLSAKDFEGDDKTTVSGSSMLHSLSKNPSRKLSSQHKPKRFDTMSAKPNKKKNIRFQKNAENIIYSKPVYKIDISDSSSENNNKSSFGDSFLDFSASDGSDSSFNYKRKYSDATRIKKKLNKKRINFKDYKSSQASFNKYNPGSSKSSQINKINSPSLKSMQSEKRDRATSYNSDMINIVKQKFSTPNVIIKINDLGEGLRRKKTRSPKKAKSPKKNLSSNSPRDVSFRMIEDLIEAGIHEEESPSAKMQINEKEKRRFSARNKIVPFG